MLISPMNLTLPLRKIDTEWGWAPTLALCEGQVPDMNKTCVVLQQSDLNLDKRSRNKLPGFLPGSVVYAFSASCLQKE